jgi:hypothetical protein
LDHQDQDDPRHKTHGFFTGYEIEGYVRDRTKSINKDWSLQGYNDIDTRLHPICVSQIEQFARYHITNDHEHCELDKMYFQQQLNDRTLNERLKTLIEFYDKARLDGMTESHPSGILKNEAEFRAYFLVLQANNKGGTVDLIQKLRSCGGQVLNSLHMQLAFQVLRCMWDGNYVEFFNIIKHRVHEFNQKGEQGKQGKQGKQKHHPASSYLFSCIMHKYFFDVQYKALCRMVKAYHPSKRSKPVEFPLSRLTDILMYNDEYHAEGDLTKLFGLKVKGDINDGAVVVFDRNHPPVRAFVETGCFCLFLLVSACFSVFLLVSLCFSVFPLASPCFHLLSLAFTCLYSYKASMYHFV